MWIFQNPCCHILETINKIFQKNGVAVICNASLLIFFAPKFSTWYLVKWPVPCLQWSPKNLAPSVLVLNEQTYFFHTLSRNIKLPLALFWETIRESSLAWAWTGIAQFFNNAIENMSKRLNFILRYYFVLFWTCWCYTLWNKNGIGRTIGMAFLYFGLWNKNGVERMQSTSYLIDMAFLNSVFETRIV